MLLLPFTQDVCQRDLGHAIKRHHEHATRQRAMHDTAGPAQRVDERVRRLQRERRIPNHPQDEAHWQRLPSVLRGLELSLRHEDGQRFVRGCPGVQVRIRCAV